MMLSKLTIIHLNKFIDLIPLVNDKISFTKLFSNDFLLEQLLDFFSFEEIFSKIERLNKGFKEKINAANYLLLEKLGDTLNITSSFLSSDLPASSNVVALYKDAIKSLEDTTLNNLQPNGFYTDSGLVGTNMWYGMHNIFQENSTMYYGYIFSSAKGSNNHIQAYLGNPHNYDNTFCQALKSLYEVKPGSKEIMVPYERQPVDGHPTFQVPRSFEINCKNQGYAYYGDRLMLCFSESEVENSRFHRHTNFFKDKLTVESIKESGIPILNMQEDQFGTVIEFDLSK